MTQTMILTTLMTQTTAIATSNWQVIHKNVAAVR